MIPVATTPPRLITLVRLTAVSVLSTNLYLASLATMAADFAVPYGLPGPRDTRVSGPRAEAAGDVSDRPQ